MYCSSDLQQTLENIYLSIGASEGTYLELLSGWLLTYLVRGTSPWNPQLRQSNDPLLPVASHLWRKQMPLMADNKMQCTKFFQSWEFDASMYVKDVEVVQVDPTSQEVIKVVASGTLTY